MHPCKIAQGKYWRIIQFAPPAAAQPSDCTTATVLLFIVVLHRRLIEIVLNSFPLPHPPPKTDLSQLVVSQWNESLYDRMDKSELHILWRTSPIERIIIIIRQGTAAILGHFVTQFGGL